MTKSRGMLGSTCSTHGGDDKLIEIYTKLAGKPEGNKLLGRFRRISDNDTGMDLREVRWKCVDWMHLA
jgi:hypothetical protein